MFLSKLLFLSVVAVVLLAARQRLPCDLSENYEITKYCGKCSNVFDDGVFDFDCTAKDGEDIFMAVLMESKDLIIESRMTVEDFAWPKNGGNGHPLLLKLLWDRGYQIHPFLKAAMFNNLSEINDIYFKNSSVIKEVDSLGANALIIASQFGNTSTIKYLLNIGMNINSTDPQMKNCFIAAAYGRKPKNLKFFNENYPYLKNHRDENNETALHLASGFGDFETVKFLVDEIGININEIGIFGRNCFLNAVYGSKIKTMRFLNSKNPQLKNARDDYQENALTLACGFADLKTVKFLVEEMHFGLNVIGAYGRNCFQSAMFNTNFNRKIEIMRYLDSKDPDLKNVRDEQHDTALNMACGFSDLETVKFLIEEIQIDICQTGYNGRNCFLNAASVGKIKTMRYIDSKNSDLKYGRDNDGNSVLTLAKNNETQRFLINEMKMEG